MCGSPKKVVWKHSWVENMYQKWKWTIFSLSLVAYYIGNYKLKIDRLENELDAMGKNYNILNDKDDI